MSARFYDRLAATLSLVLLLGLAAITTYLAQQASNATIERAEKRITHDPDYFVEGFQFTSVNARGEAAYRVSAQRLEHYPDDDSVSYRKPILISLDPDKPQVAIRAERGTASSGGEQTRLYDNVVLTRQADANRDALTITTDFALILSNEDIVRSDRPVLIRSGASSLQGVGMEFNNMTRQLRIDAQVKGQWFNTPAASR
jgi:lipopolysaccharide export system protein LptC